jgi:hypothetical protein
MHRLSKLSPHIFFVQGGHHFGNSSYKLLTCIDNKSFSTIKKKKVSETPFQKQAKHGGILLESQLGARHKWEDRGLKSVWAKKPRDHT